MPGTTTSNFDAALQQARADIEALQSRVRDQTAPSSQPSHPSPPGFQPALPSYPPSIPAPNATAAFPFSPAGHVAQAPQGHVATPRTHSHVGNSALAATPWSGPGPALAGFKLAFEQAASASSAGFSHNYSESRSGHDPSAPFSVVEGVQHVTSHGMPRDQPTVTPRSRYSLNSVGIGTDAVLFEPEMTPRGLVGAQHLSQIGLSGPNSAREQYPPPYMVAASPRVGHGPGTRAATTASVLAYPRQDFDERLRRSGTSLGREAAPILLGSRSDGYADCTNFNRDTRVGNKSCADPSHNHREHSYPVAYRALQVQAPSFFPQASNPTFLPGNSSSHLSPAFSSLLPLSSSPLHSGTVPSNLAPPPPFAVPPLLFEAPPRQ
eukprot:2700356-Rhodomonas_salina.1